MSEAIERPTPRKRVQVLTIFDPYSRKSPIGEEISTSFSNWLGRWQRAVSKTTSPGAAEFSSLLSELAPLHLLSCNRSYNCRWCLIHIREILQSDESHPRHGASRANDSCHMCDISFWTKILHLHRQRRPLYRYAYIFHSVYRFLTLWVRGNKIQSWISLEISGPPPLFTHDRKGERATRFRVESVWKCLGLILSAHMTGRVRGLPKISVESVWKC